MPEEMQEEQHPNGRPAAGDSFDDELRGALVRLEAPDGFTERLMARVDALSKPRGAARAKPGVGRGVLHQLSRPVWRVAYAAAALLALTAGAIHVKDTRAEQRRADAASAQFDTALEVTDRALARVSTKLEKTEFGVVQRALESDKGEQR